MKPSFLISVAVGLLLAGCGKNNSSPHPQGTNTTTSVQPAPSSADYLGTLMRADKYAVKTIDVSYLNQAVQLFNTQEGRLPKDLMNWYRIMWANCQRRLTERNSTTTRTPARSKWCRSKFRGAFAKIAQDSRPKSAGVLLFVSPKLPTTGKQSIFI